MKVEFIKKMVGRNQWAIQRVTDGVPKTLQMTTSALEAERFRSELEKCDKQSFYEGLLVGQSQ